MEQAVDLMPWMEVHLQSARSQPKTTEPAIDKALKFLTSYIKMVSMKNHWLLLKIMSKDSFHGTKLPNNKPAY
jgi:hypothetical protein